MPTYVLTDPSSGQKVKLTGDSPPTEAEVIEIFSGLPTAQAPTQPTIGDEIVGGLETAAAIGSSVAGEIGGGIAGLATSLIPGTESGSGAAVAQGVRDALTFQPSGDEANRNLQAVGDFVTPAAEVFSGVEDTLGQGAVDLTQAAGDALGVDVPSEVLATAGAIGKTAPTAFLELIGASTAKGFTKLKTGKELDSLIKTSLPSVDELKGASRKVFNELSEQGTTVKPEAIGTLTDNIERAARKAGARPRTNTEAFGVIDEFKDIVEEGRVIDLDELDELRTVAQNAAKSIDPSKKAPALAMIDEIDGFLDDAGTDILNSPKGKNIGAEYRSARKVWGRARRAEVVEELFTNAKDTASGFENGLRIEARKLLKSKKRSRFFTKGEQQAIRRISEGTTATNAAKMVGRLGFSEGQAINIVNPLLGGAAGAAVFGTAGGVAVPLIGQVAKGLAQRLTANSGKFADQVVRAGGNADEIAKAYIRNTPKAQRSAAELSQLFIKNEIDLSTVKNAIAKEAADIAQQARSAQVGAAVGGVIKPENE